MTPSPFPLSRWTSLVLLAMGLGVAFFWGLRPQPRPLLQVLILPAKVDGGGTDVGPGLETLFADQLEILAGATVLRASTLPPGMDLKALPPDMHLFRFQVRREGDLLALSPAWSTPARLKAEAPWTTEALPPMDPRAAMAAWVRHWPLLRAASPGDAELLPRSAAHFWQLVKAMSIQGDQEATAHLDETEQLVAAEPRCATAWTTLGDHLYRSLWVKPDQAGIGLNSRTHKVFQKAVELIPGHPRATFLWSLMLTDTGNQGAALRALQVAVRHHPNVPDLYQGFAYAGRTAGLLEGARAALARRRALLPAMAPSSVWTTETTDLYFGDWAGFDLELQRAGAVRSDAGIRFYQGYSALLKGDRAGALRHMQAGEQLGVPGPFQDLCRVYRALLEGHAAEALADLRHIDDVRGKLRIPDGELTFKEAEAYALLGDQDRAVDCATRAFVQGFSCARWYESSPFLDPMRSHPRWPMLRRNIRERQAVLAGSFPVSAFGP